MISEWPHCTNLSEIEFVIAWNAPQALWAQLPNLKVVQSYGAGVDGIELDHLLPHVVVTRIVDTGLADDMAEYVLTHALAHKLRLREYNLKQHLCEWKPRRVKPYNHVGILGLGELGQAAAKRFLNNGFIVSGWSRTKKSIEGVTSYHGEAAFNQFLESLDYIVCLLPLTVQTSGILNRTLFEQVPAHCVLINVARGQHLIDEDLIWALDNNKLAGATLDVFSEEPLPSEHPFWHHPLITMTPHCAAITDLTSVCEQITININASNEQRPLQNIIDRSAGY
ncbi:gyoxylate/hydroxypyruvate reductase A [Pseudoalteromonas citrea]|uniref:Gyoxylate/hydroxypyruvate reductase A n=2 Tax=Pseudoalteromonas citrea TaxID=43655 RepID=A0AAD4FTA3_9GAMM|nr:gyoxylate/hydroxypyruvate reductase A [Pseudoalteromonas citrea]